MEAPLDCFQFHCYAILDLTRLDFSGKVERTSLIYGNLACFLQKDKKLNSDVRALFLDRDGVINVDHGYTYRVGDIEFIPGILELSSYTVNQLGWKLIIVTNQSGIGRQLFSELDFSRLMYWMREQFYKANAPITAVYHCPYHPTEGVGHYKADHPWRKPKPGMILQAAADHGINLASSALVGDSESDIKAGATAGIGTLILFNPHGLRKDANAGACHIVASLSQVPAILRRADMGRPLSSTES
jgi:D-glycero-D-manno-heptose 1,7-bisphosphate phosphatase